MGEPDLRTSSSPKRGHLPGHVLRAGCLNQIFIETGSALPYFHFILSTCGDLFVICRVPELDRHSLVDKSGESANLNGFHGHDR
jgi:hypothetical protein